MRPCDHCGQPLENNVAECVACHRSLTQPVGINPEETLHLMDEMPEPEQGMVNMIRFCILCALIGPPLIGGLVFGVLGLMGGFIVTAMLVGFVDIPTMLFE